jgi:hypothetical protein
LPEATTTLVPANVPASIRWRGDAISFIDVFDTPNMDSLLSTNVVRVFYPNSRSSTAEAPFAPTAIFASMPLPPWPGAPGWRGARAIRQYDRGECSFFMPWRTALNALVNPPSVGQPAPLEAALQNLMVPGVGTVNVVATSTLNLRPILRVNGQDALKFSGNFNIYTTSFGFVGTLNLQIQLRIIPQPGPPMTAGLSAIVETDSTVVDYMPNAISSIGAAFGLSQTEAQVEAGIRAQLNAAIPNAVRAAIPTAAQVVAFDRIFERPDGLELVMAEDTTDLQFSLISAAGFCGRPTGGSAQTGRLVDLADPPCSLPPALGETRPATPCGP